MAKILLDDPESIKYSNMAGKFLSNFGTIEFLSIEWYMALTEAKPKLSKVYGLTLSERINRILELIEKTNRFDRNQKTEIVDVWKKLKNDGLKLRNSIAHAPFWQLRPNSQEGTQFINCQGFLTFNKKTNTEELISYEELSNGVNATKVLADKLLAFHIVF